MYIHVYMYAHIYMQNAAMGVQRSSLAHACRGEPVDETKMSLWGQYMNVVAGGVMLKRINDIGFQGVTTMEVVPL